MLEFGAKMPFSYNNFLSRCQERLARSDMDIVKRASILPYEDIDDPSPTLREWKRFDTTLRNELARSRAAKFTKDPLLYIRGEDYPDPSVSSLVQWVVNLDSPLEAELCLDRFRWEKIGQLKKGHYFDIDYLITYALELQILERWERIDSKDGMRILEALLSA